MPTVSITPENKVVIDGKTIDPATIGKNVPVVLSDIELAYKALRSRKNWTLKNLEKLLAYGAAVVAATNGFSAAGLPPTIREWLLGASALVIAALHVSTPVATP